LRSISEVTVCRRARNRVVLWVETSVTYPYEVTGS